MEIRVKRDRCEANAVCVGLAPAVFQLDDDEQLIVLQPDPPEELMERVSLAIARCPKDALEIVS
jgi:ferredoxin